MVSAVSVAPSARGGGGIDSAVGPGWRAVSVPTSARGGGGIDTAACDGGIDTASGFFFSVTKPVNQHRRESAPPRSQLRRESAPPRSFISPRYHYRCGKRTAHQATIHTIHQQHHIHSFTTTTAHGKLCRVRQAVRKATHRTDTVHGFGGGVGLQMATGERCTRCHLFGHFADQCTGVPATRVRSTRYRYRTLHTISIP